MEKSETKYKIEFKQVNSSATISTSSRNINAITFINKSTDNFPAVNGYALEAGEAFAINGNENEIDEGIYNITIDETVGTPNFWAIIKYNF